MKKGRRMRENSKWKERKKKKKERKIRADVIGDIIYDKFLAHFSLNRELGFTNGKPIFSFEMIKNNPGLVKEIQYAYLTGNFNAMPHEGMNLLDMIEDDF